MINLRRLNGEEVWVNQDQIRLIECRPDTMITFIDGKTILVRETPAEIRQLVMEFTKACHQGKG